MERRKHETELVEKHFGPVTVCPEFSWLIVEQFLLPAGRYNRTETRLLHFLGPGYPQTPPDNFLVPTGLRTAADGMPGDGYSEGAVHFGTAWGTFSWHAKEWRPAAEVLDGDNLVTFLVTVQKRLAE